MRLGYNSEVHKAYIGDNSHVPGFGEQGTLHYRVPKELLLTKLHLSRSGDRAKFPNT